MSKAQSYYTAIMVAYLYGHMDVCKAILDFDLKQSILISQLLIEEFRPSDDGAVTDVIVSFLKDMLADRLKEPHQFIYYCRYGGARCMRSLRN